MTEQQERMSKEILSTVRSLQKCDNRGLIDIVARVTEEIFKAAGPFYKIMMSSYRNPNNDSRKIQVIKVIREQTGMGLKEAKDLVDRLDDNYGEPMDLITGLDIETAEKVNQELKNMGLSPSVEKE